MLKKRHCSKRLVLVVFFLFSLIIGSNIIHADSKKSQAGITFSGDGSIEVKIILTKKDIETKENLSGAIFELYKIEENGESNLIKQNLETNKNGQTQIDRIIPGQYKFIEKKSPDGYQLDKTPIYFNVDFDKTNHSLVAYNKKIISDKKETSTTKKTQNLIKRRLPKTGSIHSYILSLVGAFLLILATFYYFNKYKKN